MLGISTIFKAPIFSLDINWSALKSISLETVTTLVSWSNKALPLWA